MSTVLLPPGGYPIRVKYILYYYTKRYQTRIRQAVHNSASFSSKIMPHFTQLVRGFMITSAADFAATSRSPAKFTTHRARIVLIFRKRCDGTITGSINLLHLRTPPKIWCPPQRLEHISGRTQYCDRQWQTTQHGRENKHSKGLFQYISNKMQRYTVYFIWKLLYMFRVVPSPIIRGAYNCIYSIWYLSHRYYYLPLSWMSWNRFECSGSSNGVTNTRCCRYSCIRP